MHSTYSPAHSGSRPPTLGGLIVLVGMILLGGALSSGLLLGFIALFRGISFADAQQYLTGLLRNPSRTGGNWYELIALQGVNHMGTYLLPSLLYWYYIERRNWAQFNHRPLATVVGLGLAVAIIIVFMPFDGLVIEWNQDLHLPQTLAPLEQWMRDQEKSLAGVTKFLTTLERPDQLLLALLVVGVVAAVGEEVLFRGILQRNLIYWTGNPHVGVWVAAILFSAIHVQFLGFFPRVLLGALFGYLYLWSGNLWVAILAHFVNNGFTLVMVYLYQHKRVSVNIEGNESVPVLGALMALVVTIGLLAYFRQLNTESAQPPGLNEH